MGQGAAAGDELADWTDYYDRLEQAIRLLAGVMTGPHATTGPGWTFLPPPLGALPAELVARHDTVLGQLRLLTDAAALRLTDLRRELDALPHHGPASPTCASVGRALDVFG